MSELPTSAPLGATRLADGDWRFVVWAPRHHAITLQLLADGAERTVPMEPCPGGYFAAQVSGLDVAPAYRFQLPDGSALADPASRWQPEAEPRSPRKSAPWWLQNR